MPSFCSRIDSKCNTVLSLHIPCSLWQAFSLSWSFMTVTLLKSTNQLFWAVFLGLGLSDVFSQFDWDDVVCLVKAMVFPVVMCGCESWTIKKAEHWGIDAFKLWYWRRLLRISWAVRWSNQSILKAISPEYLLQEFKSDGFYFVSNMVSIWLPVLWPPDAKNWLIGTDPDAGKDWKQEEKGVAGWDGWMASATQWT